MTGTTKAALLLAVGSTASALLEVASPAASVSPAPLDYSQPQWSQKTCSRPYEANRQTLSAGQAHTCAVLNSGGVVCWGDNSRGQLNVPLSAQAGQISVSAGAYHTCSLSSTHDVTCWGEWLADFVCVCLCWGFAEAAATAVYLEIPVRSLSLSLSLQRISRCPQETTITDKPPSRWT